MTCATLYAYVDTALPGYRIVDVAGTDYQVADGYQRFDAYLTALDTALTAAGWSHSVGSDGVVTLTGGGAAVVTFEDRIGWLLGWRDSDPGDSLASAASVTAPLLPAGRIPLLGATPEAVDLQRESELVVDRTLRGHGYLWGAARVWRWRLMMTAAAFETLRLGWCLRGQVSLEGAESTAIGSGQPDGAMTGYALGLESSRLVGPSAIAGYYEVTMLVAGVAT